MKRKTQKVVIEAEVPRSLTEAGVDAIDAAIKAAAPHLEHVRNAGTHRVADAQALIAPLTEQARERLAPIAEQAKERISPIAEQARERAEHLGEQAKERAEHAQEVISPFVTDAQARIAPVAREAKVRSAVGARGTIDNLAPRLEHALLAVGPLAEGAAHRLHDDVVPRANKFLDRAAEVEQLNRRQRRKARKSAARLDKAAAKVTRANAKALAHQEKSGGSAWKVLLVLTGLVGLGLLVAKKLSGPKQDAWQNYQPTPPAPAASPQRAAESPEPAAAPAADSEDETMAPDELEAEVEMIGEGGHVSAADATLSTDTATTYGEGSFVGTEPPAKYPIKANPRSMKYHLPGSDSFNRTISDVWFTTEEAAEAAGFTKAQR